MIEEVVLRKAKILKKEEDYSNFIRNIRQTVSDTIISDISPLYLSEPRGVYQNKSLHVIKPRSTKEVSECFDFVHVTHICSHIFVKTSKPFSKSA